MTDLRQALLDLRTAFPGRDVPVETLALYSRQLADLPEAEVVDAVYRLLRTSKFFPTVAELREAAVTSGATEGLAEVEWTQVQREVRRVGWNRGPVMQGGELREAELPSFASAITAAAVESMTWRLICLGDAAAVREQFLWTWKNVATGLIKRRQAVDGGRPALAAAGEPLRLEPGA